MSKKIIKNKNHSSGGVLEKTYPEILQNLQEDTCIWVSFLLQYLRSQNIVSFFLSTTFVELNWTTACLTLLA